MAELPTTSPAEGAATERDVLVATKFHVPPAGFVPRPRLLARLAQGIARGLTVVCTPAGFGKTTLLADWVRRSRRPVAWLSLDAGDNDPARFWRYVAAALERVRPGVRAPVAALLRGPQSPPLEAVATAVINRLAALPGEGEVTLVLDDYHLIEAPSAHGSVRFLLERLPPGLRLVLASRADPPLPLARLRARGQLAELRAGDLRFTLAETAAFLREATGLELPVASVAALQERTEGWAVGVQLAALSLRGRSDPAGFVETFAGSHRYVLDYLTQEVLARQPEPVMGFLLETSVLERLSGPLCDAVTGRTGSQALLEALERANVFLVPLDEVRGWWRYHHLFADLLRARLAHERPERLPQLHRAAAGWHEEHGFADDAVRHAVAAGEAAWAARLVERHVEALLRRSEGATLGRWLAALPTETIRSRARLCLAQAVSAIVGGRFEAVEPLLVDAERAFAITGEEPHEPSVGRALSVLANVPASVAFLRADLARLRGDPARAVACDQQALTHLGEGDWLLRSHVHWNLGRPTGCAGGSRRPSTPWPRWSPSGGRPARATWRCGWATTSDRYSEPKAAWARRWPATSSGWRVAARSTASCRIWAWRTWAWPRCCTNATSLTSPASTPPEGWRCAGSWPSPSRWPPALGCWRGSGRRRAMRSARWRRSARPSASS
jgi:ATP/maltotriose-dependent transcriptional regulator MalT